MDCFSFLSLSLSLALSRHLSLIISQASLAPSFHHHTLSMSYTTIFFLPFTLSGHLVAPSPQSALSFAPSLSLFYSLSAPTFRQTVVECLSGNQLRRICSLSLFTNVVIVVVVVVAAAVAEFRRRHFLLLLFRIQGQELKFIRESHFVHRTGKGPLSGPTGLCGGVRMRLVLVPLALASGIESVSVPF